MLSITVLDVGVIYIWYYVEKCRGQCSPVRKHLLDKTRENQKRDTPAKDKIEQKQEQERLKEDKEKLKKSIKGVKASLSWNKFSLYKKTCRLDKRGWSFSVETRCYKAKEDKIILKKKKKLLANKLTSYPHLKNRMTRWLFHSDQTADSGICISEANWQRRTTCIP